MVKRSVPQPISRSERPIPVPKQRSIIPLHGYKEARADVAFEKYLVSQSGRVKEVYVQLEGIPESPDPILTIVIESLNPKSVTSMEIPIKDGKLQTKNLEAMLLVGDIVSFTLNVGCQVLWNISMEI